MAFGLTWSPAARLDLAAILSYIAESDPEAARRFAREIFSTVERLPDFPESGRIVPEFSDPAIREVLRRPCRIVYRLRREDEVVEIVRVWHTARIMPEL